MKTYQLMRNLVHLYWIALLLLITAVVGIFYFNQSESETLEDDIAINSTNPIFNTPELTLGKELFRVNCASCHNKDMKSILTGPPLSGVSERWSEYPVSDLYAWIRNADRLIEAGHPRAVELYDEWKPTRMNSFTNLKDEEITAILAYIEAFD